MRFPQNISPLFEQDQSARQENKKAPWNSHNRIKHDSSEEWNFVCYRTASLPRYCSRFQRKEKMNKASGQTISKEVLLWDKRKKRELNRHLDFSFSIVDLILRHVKSKWIFRFAEQVKTIQLVMRSANHERVLTKTREMKKFRESFNSVLVQLLSRGRKIHIIVCVCVLFFVHLFVVPWCFSDIGYFIDQLMFAMILKINSYFTSFINSLQVHKHNCHLTFRNKIVVEYLWQHQYQLL